MVVELVHILVHDESHELLEFRYNHHCPIWKNHVLVTLAVDMDAVLVNLHSTRAFNLTRQRPLTLLSQLITKSSKIGGLL